MSSDWVTGPDCCQDVLETQVKRAVELSIDPHLRIPGRPGQPTRIMRVCWEHLAHGSVIQRAPSGKLSGCRWSPMEHG